MTSLGMPHSYLTESKSLTAPSRLSAPSAFTKAQLVLRDMNQEGKAHFVIGGQWGSEGKGAASSWLASEMQKEGVDPYDVVTGNMGAQSGHTSVHQGVKRVAFHLPTYPLIYKSGMVYLNAGSVIDPDVFKEELKLYDGPVFIHPLAAVITPACKEAEGRADSNQTKIASTRKGVGEALSRKVLRSGMVAKDHPFLRKFVKLVNLNHELRASGRVLIEIPQGVSLSLNHSGFYPHTTSRDCTPMMAMSDAGVHPSFYGATLMVLRTYPIRVGNIVEGGTTLGQSGGCYSDQEETSWDKLETDAEITTVTKRVRRVFTFSKIQLRESMNLCRPDAILFTFCDYVKNKFYLEDIEHSVLETAYDLGMPPPRLLYQFGPSTDDVKEEYEEHF